MNRPTPTPLPPVPRIVAWTAIGAMFAVLGCVLAIPRVESIPVAVALATVGLGGPSLWSWWMRRVLSRAGGAFAVPAIRDHAASHVEQLPMMMMPLVVGTLSIFALPGPFMPGDDLAQYDTAVMKALTLAVTSLGLFFLLPALAFWRVNQQKRLAQPAWEQWLARRHDPRVLGWTALRDRAGASDRTRALADDVLQELEALLEHAEAHQVRLAEIDAALERLEASLGPPDSTLSARTEDAVAELAAVSEVDRMASARAAAQARQRS